MAQKQQELVSVITPMYKGAELVGETIESVIGQSYKNWEMIIVDDCSPDNRAGIKVVRQYQKQDKRIRLIELRQNRGSSGARNEAIKAAQGNFTAFLDADDLWNVDFLEKQLRFLEKQDAVIVFSSYRRIDEKTKEEILRPFIVPTRVGYDDILKSLPICPSTALCNIQILGKRYFREDLGSMRDDYAYWLSILRDRTYFAYGNKEILASYRLRKNSATANKLKVLIPHWNILYNIEKLSFLKSCYYFCLWSWISYRKYRK